MVHHRLSITRRARDSFEITAACTARLHRNSPSALWNSSMPSIHENSLTRAYARKNGFFPKQKFLKKVVYIRDDSTHSGVFTIIINLSVDAIKIISDS